MILIMMILPCCLFIGCDPVTFKDAYLDKKWKRAMDEEIKFIENNDTWELATHSKGNHAIGIKWVYKTNRNAKEVEKHKARLAVKGYKHQ